MRHPWIVATSLVLACGAKRPTPAPNPAPRPAFSPPESSSTSPPLPPLTLAAETRAAPRSLFERLGGRPAIDAVVDDFVDRTFADVRVKERFFDTDIVRLKRLIAELVCQASGGPCQYSGRDMGPVHTGQQVIDAEFDAIASNLVAALAKLEVGAREQAELVGAIESFRSHIVVSPDQLRPLDAHQLARVTATAARLPAAHRAARDLLTAAVLAGSRGQRSYAEQLFTRAELAVGDRRFDRIAATFRAGGPPRLNTALRRAAAGSTPQPRVVGSSDEDAPPARRAAGSLVGSLQVEGTPLNGLGVIMLTPDRGGRKRTAKVRVVEQRGKAFAPRLLAVPVGSTVEFPNFDSIFHNVFSLSKARAFDLGMYRSGALRDVTFDKPGLVRVGCNIHANMSAYIVVVDAPHYVVVESDGRFRFRSLAPGRYTVRAWSERSATPVVTRIVVKPGVNEHVFDLAADAGPGPNPDKFGVIRAGGPRPTRSERP